MTVVKIKKQKTQKSVSKNNNNNKFEDYKNCLEAAQLKNYINHLEKKNEIDVDSLKKDHKELIENNKLILKTQLRFQRERHNVFTEEINEISLSSNDD